MVNNHDDQVCPQRIGLWDPFQMAELHGLGHMVTQKLPSPAMILLVTLPETHKTASENQWLVDEISF